MATTNASPWQPTLSGNNAYLQGINGAGAMACSIDASTVTCNSSRFGGQHPTVDRNGVLHVAYFAMYGNDPRQVAVFEAGPYQSPTRKTVTGISNNLRTIAFGSDGNLYATLVNSHAVWKIDRTTWVATVFAGSDTETGDVGGTTSTARFTGQLAVQQSEAGLYVKDTNNRIVYEIKL
jgi:hypothetical protein